MMRAIVAAVVLWCGIVSAATFTDVTAEGTPYLTTNIMHEIRSAFIDRILTTDTGDFGYSTNYTSSAEGTPANARSYFSASPTVTSFGVLVAYIRRFVMTRRFGQTPTTGWVVSIPTNAYSYADITYSNTVDYLAAIGLSSNGWRKATSYNPETNDWRNPYDPMYATNSVDEFLSVGEILGPWIIDDLQIVLGALRHYAIGQSTYSADWIIAGTNAYGQGGDTDASWSVAKSTAEADYELYSNGTYPMMATEGRKNSATWTANIYTRKSKVEVGAVISGNPVSTLGGSISFVSKGTAYSGGVRVFDNNGIDVALGSNMVFSTVAVAAGNTNAVYSDDFGSTDIPAWVDQPVDQGVWYSRGWESAFFDMILSPDYPLAR